MSNNSNIAGLDGFVPDLGVTPGAVAVPLLSFITLVLDVPAFVWHIKNRNLPASVLVFWIILSNLMNFVNAIIWPNDNMPTWYDGQGLCDIEVKLDLAATLGLVGALASIMASLARALDTSKTVVSQSNGQRQRRNLIDCLICFGPPFYMVLVHYVVQPFRYYIFAIAGCTPSVDNSWPSIALLYIWPPIFCLVDGYHCVLVIYRLLKYRRDFAAILNSTSSGLTRSRFLRLFFVSFIIVVVFLPVQFYILYENAMFPLQPYSWSRIHGPTWSSEIVLVPTDGAVQFDRWIRIALGFTVFACFGLGNEAVRMYKAWLLKVGFGYIFPTLRHEKRRLSHGRSETMIGSRNSSMVTKAKQFFIRKSSQISQNSSVISTISSPHSTTNSFPRLASVAKTTHSGSTHSHLYTEKRAPGAEAESTDDRPVVAEGFLARFIHGLFALKAKRPRSTTITTGMGHGIDSSAVVIDRAYTYASPV